ncbi:18083_t:CDS:1, partial [Acaulospora morrowiae]
SLDQIQELQSKLTDVNQQVSDLGSKLSILQDNHNKKLSNLADSESKYRASLLLIQDLQDQLEESQRRHSGIIEELHSISSTPMTPMSSYPESRNEDLLPPKPIVPFVTSRPPLHRKAKSMSSVETGGAGMTDSAHAAIIEKLQFELELFESFHEDKSQSLDAVKRELNRLEQHHQETLLVVDELREEIKRRDALALLHVNMVINSSEKETNSTKNDRIDELIVVNRLRKEIEELKERQRQTMQNILEREKDNKLRSEEARKLQLSIWQLREELSFAIEEQKYANDTEKTPSSRESIVSKLLSRIRESEEQLAVMRGDVQHVGDFLHDSNDSCDAEMIELRRQAEKLQADIQTKSQAIAIFLLPEELLGSEETHIRTVNDNIINHITKNGLSDTTDNDYLEKASSDKLGLLPRHFTNQTQDTLDVIQSKLSTVQGSKGDLMSLLQPHFETLKAEFRRKDKLIESLKHDLVDKGMLHQKLRESEAEIFVLLQRLNATKKQESPDQVSQLEDISKDTGKSLKESEKGYHNNSEKEAFVLERLRNLDAEESKIQKELERIITQELSEHDQLNCAKKPAQLISMKSSNGNEKLIVEQLRTQLNDVKEAKKTIIHEWESMELTFRAQARLVITLESEMQTLTDALNVAKEGHAEALKKSENLQAQVKTLENQLTEVEKERGEYARRVNDLLQTMESHEIQKKDLVSSLERKVSDLDSQIHDLKEALKNSSDTLNEKEQLSSAKDSHIKELQSSIQKVKDEFKAIEVAKSAESERAREFQSNIVFLESKIVDLEARLRANPSPEDLETAQQSAAKNLVLVKEMETKLEEANHQNAAEIATIRETISKLTTELEEKRIAENAQKQLVKELEGVLSEREGKLKEVNKQLGQVKESEQRQVEQIQSLEVQLQILQKSRDEEVMKLEEANAEIENLKEQYMCLHDDTLIPVQNLENLEKIMSNDLKIQLEQCQQTIMELEGKMVQLENEKGEQ